MVIRTVLLSACILLTSLAGSLAFAQAEEPKEPVLRLINFTADWCPNCRVLNPRLEEALEELDHGLVERVDLDMSRGGSNASDYDKVLAWNEAIRVAESKQARYLWDWYGGITGIAVIISADNGEPISCVNRRFSKDQIVGRLKQAEIISKRRPAGSRMPEGPECPAPMR